MKLYMEVRDFDNKSEFMNNFTGDPFRKVHEMKTEMRQAKNDEAS